MAVELQAAAAVTISKQERTWRAELETPNGKPYTLNVHREAVVVDSNGIKLYNDETLAKSYSFPFDDIKDVNVTVGGNTLTVGQIAGFVQVAFDQLVAAKKAEAVQ